MQLNNYIQTKFPFFVALSLTFLFASCGSYQYVGYDNDGIYGSEDVVVYEETRTVPVESPESQSAYKDYFTEKSLQYGSIPNDGSAIFTDIDSYEGNYDEELEQDVQTGYAGWGQANENVTINIYDNSWAQPWGWNAGFGYGWNRPWGFNNWGWNRPWGFNNWGWNAGFGYGWNNWGWNGGFGFNNGWCPPGFNGFYGNNFYRNNRVAYNAGRRGNNFSSLNRSSVNRRNNVSSSRLRSNMSRRSNPNSIRTRTSIPRRSNSSVRPRSSNSRSNSTTRPRTSTPRRNNSSVRSSNRNNSRSSAPRASSSRRSSGNSSSARSSRSSSSRSSSGSSRGGSSRRSSGRG